MKSKVYELDIFKKTLEVEDEALLKTKKILAALEFLAKEHNKTSSHKTSAAELKKVFKKGAEIREHAGNPNPNYHGLARVEMYLAFLEGHITMKSTGGRIYKPTKQYIIDLSEAFSPSEQDYQRADKNVVEFGLNFTYSSVDELYLDEDEEIPAWLGVLL
jgi:hypothetical protein